MLSTKDALIRFSYVITMLLILNACAGVPPIKPDSISFKKAAEIEIPVKARMSVFMKPNDLNKKRYLHAGPRSLEIREGERIQSAAIKVFGQLFQEVLPNQDSKMPHLIGKINGLADINTFWGIYRGDATVLLYYGNGDLIGKFSASGSTTTMAVLDATALENAYVKAFQQIANQLLENEELLKHFRGGFGDELTSPRKASLEKEPRSETLQRKRERYVPFGGAHWAVVIGISNYLDSQIPFLRYASNDANSFHQWLISKNGGRYASSRIKLLIDEHATGSNIKNALFVWLGQALAEDMVTIYFAGHGSPQSPDNPNNLFLLPYDTNYDDIATTGFPMWDIETAFKRFIKAKKVVVIADACHAAGVGQSFDVARRANRAIKINPISTGLQNLSKVGDGLCVISASDDKQYSQEGQKWGGGHGVFTYFLLKGLTGEADYNKDNGVTLGELIPYLSEQVRRATSNAQSPTVAGKFDPALSIGR